MPRKRFSRRPTVRKAGVTSATAFLRPQTSAAAEPIEAGVLECALIRGWHRLRFPRTLERAYEDDTSQTRSWRHIVCNLLGILMFVLLSGRGDVDLPGSPSDLQTLRVTVVVAALAGVLLHWLGRRRIRDATRDALTALGTLGIAGYACTALPFVSGTPALMHTSGVVLVFLHIGIGARLQFRFAVAVNLFVYLAYAACARSSGGESALVLQNHLLLFGVVMVFGTAGNYLLERSERHGYLLACLKNRRHAALLRDAGALRELTVRDGLTQLHNRRHFDAELGRAWAEAQRAGRPVGLLQVDVDHFKRYNDHYGHPAGDRCLTDVAAVLEAVAARHDGLAARVGGEEFALLFPGQDASRVAAVAAETCDAVRALGVAHAGSTSASIVTVSVGAAALTPASGLWASSLVGAADAALYAAKSQGRNSHASCETPLAAAASPRQRRGSESLSPEPDAPADDLARIDRLTGLLGRGLRSLRFPADIETEFQERDATARRRQLAFASAGGMGLLLVYVALCRPMLADVADTLMRHLLALTIVALAMATLNLKLAFGWRVREGIVSAMITVFGLAIAAIESRSTSATVYSATLGVCLLPMFGSLVVAQPLRFCLVPSLLICGAVATWMAPADPVDRDCWSAMLGVLVSATVYSLLGGYLLERAKRRAYVLDRLRVAQLSVLQRNTAHLTRLATVDSLTRLPNRRHFEAELERLAAACASTRMPLGLLILDIDHFKNFNDGYGHPAGDACLQRVAAALLQWAQDGAQRTADGGAPVPARIGGEEFGVLLPGCDASVTLATAQRLRQRLHELRIDHAHSPIGRFLTVSIGAASVVLDSAADSRLLLKAADAALYRAKGLGRDQAAA